MNTFLRTALTTMTAVTLIGGAVTLVVAPDAPAASSSTAAQVEDEVSVGSPLLESPVPAPGSAVVLLESLQPNYAGEGLPATQRVVLSRDPFRPVVPRPDEPTAGDPTDPSNPGTPTDPTDPGDPTDPTNPGDPTGPTNPGDPVDPDDPTAPRDACSGDDEETVCDGRVVTLDGFAEDGSAIVTIDGVQYTVGEGEEFASSFRVLATQPPCATLLYGDESFSICTGVTVLK